MSEFLKWDPSQLATEIAAMDSEHQHLIDLMNKMHQLAEQGAEKAAIVNALDELAAYTVKHFRDEEAYMDSIGWEKADRHRMIHQDLLTKLQKHADDIKSGDGSVSEDFFMFLKLWLTAHIKGIDMQYAAYAKQTSKV